MFGFGPWDGEYDWHSFEFASGTGTEGGKPRNSMLRRNVGSCVRPSSNLFWNQGRGRAIVQTSVPAFISVGKGCAQGGNKSANLTIFTLQGMIYSCLPCPWTPSPYSPLCLSPQPCSVSNSLPSFSSFPLPFLLSLPRSRSGYSLDPSAFIYPLLTHDNSKPATKTIVVNRTPLRTPTRTSQRTGQVTSW